MTTDGTALRVVDPSTPVDMGLETSITVHGDMPLEHTPGDRMMLAAICVAIVALLVKRSGNRIAWLVLAAALGAWILPKFFQAWRRGDDGEEHWAINNPFAEDGPRPVAFLT